MPIKINPSQSGWIKKLTEFRKSKAKEYNFTEITTQNWEKEYYQCLQNCGLLYGHALLLADQAEIELSGFSETDKTKIVFCDTILKGIQHQKHAIGLTNFSYSSQLFQVVKYFQHHYPGKKRSIIKGWFKKKNFYEQLESIINKRLQIKKQWKNLFVGFFCNAFIALDALLIPEYVASCTAKNGKTAYRIKKIQYIILEVIIAAMQASGNYKKQERKIFNYFLYSSNLHFYQKRRLKYHLRKSISLDKIDFTAIQNPLLKKYIFEIALLVTWADKEMEDTEEQFIDALEVKLNLPEVDADESCIQVEKFVLNNWQTVHFLQEQFNYQILTQRLTKQTGKVIVKYRHKISQEVAESKELVALLMKSTKKELTNEEKAKVKEQLKDILKTIPALAIFMLPGGSLLLPVLFKVLPEHLVLPSSFQNTDNKEEENKSS